MAPERSDPPEPAGGFAASGTNRRPPEGTSDSASADGPGARRRARRRRPTIRSRRASRFSGPESGRASALASRWALPWRLVPPIRSQPAMNLARRTARRWVSNRSGAAVERARRHRRERRNWGGRRGCRRNRRWRRSWLRSQQAVPAEQEPVGEDQREDEHDQPDEHHRDPVVDVDGNLGERRVLRRRDGGCLACGSIAARAASGTCGCRAGRPGRRHRHLALRAVGLRLVGLDVSAQGRRRCSTSCSATATSSIGLVQQFSVPPPCCVMPCSNSDRGVRRPVHGWNCPRGPNSRRAKPGRIATCLVGTRSAGPSASQALAPRDAVARASPGVPKPLRPDAWRGRRATLLASVRTRPPAR